MICFKLRFVLLVEYYYYKIRFLIEIPRWKIHYTTIEYNSLWFNMNKDSLVSLVWFLHEEQENPSSILGRVFSSTVYAFLGSLLDELILLFSRSKGRETTRVIYKYKKMVPYHPHSSVLKIGRSGEKRSFFSANQFNFIIENT